jgi:hypothetical protein
MIGVSLAIVFKGSEGMVLAADSRVTLQMPLPIQSAAPGGPSIMLIAATFDNATKLLKVTGQDHVAAVTYGAGTVGYPEARTAHSLLPEFEATLDPKTRLAVQDFAIKLSDFFAARWTQTMPAGTAVQPMAFLIGGYDENVAYGRIFEFQIPTIPTPAERHLNIFGIMWGGSNRTHVTNSERTRSGHFARDQG